MSVSESSTNWRISSIMVALPSGRGWLDTTAWRSASARAAGAGAIAGLPGPMSRSADRLGPDVAEHGLVADKLPGGGARQLLDDVQPPRALVCGEPDRDFSLHGGRLSSVR